MGSEKKCLKKYRSFPKKDTPLNKKVESNSPSPPLVTLQRTLGNNEFGGILQSKLKVNESGDIYEKKADRVADAVVNSSAPNILQESSNEVNNFQMKADTNQNSSYALPEVSSKSLPFRSSGSSLSHQQELGEGKKLESGVKARMEHAFIEDFSGVRVHDNAGAASLSNRFAARAFTIGNRVAFGAGEYQPGTMIGDALIAHELAHVVQQKDALQHKPESGNKTSQALERDANRSVYGVISSMWGRIKNTSAGIMRSVKPTLQTGLRLQRCAKTEKLEAPEYLGPQSVQTLENINEILERGDILQNTVVYGPLLPILVGPPSVPPTAAQAEAAMAVPQIVRSKIMQQISYLYLEHGKELTQEEKAYWDRLLNLMTE